MDKKILLLPLWILMFGPTTAWGQLGAIPLSDWQPELAIIKAQPLVVLLEEEDPKQLRQLAGRADELAQYKAYVAWHNTQLRDLAPKLWKFSPKVEFRSEGEYNSLRQARGATTVVLHYTQQRMGKSSSSFAGGQYSYNYLGSDLVAWMSLDLVGDGNKKNLWNGPSTFRGMLPSDIVFTFKGLQRELQTRTNDIGSTLTIRKVTAREYLRAIENCQQLPAKTLLINQAELKEQLTAAEIAQVYPYPIQVVPAEAIEAAALASDPRYAYVRWLTIKVGVAGPSIINAADGEVVATASSRENLSKSTFREFAQYVEMVDHRIAPKKAKLEEAAR